MPKTDEAWTQLATRIPKPLHRALKLHCVQAETSVMDFVIAALKKKLGRKAKKRKA
jgi:predicted HicB family RNase H-like nuclease